MEVSGMMGAKEFKTVKARHKYIMSDINAYVRVATGQSMEEEGDYSDLSDMILDELLREYDSDFKRSL